MYQYRSTRAIIIHWMMMILSGCQPARSSGRGGSSNGARARPRAAPALAAGPESRQPRWRVGGYCLKLRSPRVAPRTLANLAASKSDFDARLKTGGPGRERPEEEAGKVRKRLKKGSCWRPQGCAEHTFTYKFRARIYIQTHFMHTITRLRLA
jgi:hypothetical protein